MNTTRRVKPLSFRIPTFFENIPAIQNEVYGMLARSTGKS